MKNWGWAVSIYPTRFDNVIRQSRMLPDQFVSVFGVRFADHAVISHCLWQMIEQFPVTCCVQTISYQWAPHANRLWNKMATAGWSNSDWQQVTIRLCQKVVNNFHLSKRPIDLFTFVHISSCCFIIELKSWSFKVNEIENSSVLGSHWMYWIWNRFFFNFFGMVFQTYSNELMLNLEVTNTLQRFMM